MNNNNNNNQYKILGEYDQKTRLNCQYDIFLCVSSYFFPRL